jgi:hypothetical protein
MKNFIYYIFILLVLSSCTAESLTSTSQVCQDGHCDAEFWIDTNVNPGSYIDSQGIWHIEYSGRTYFTLKGSLDKLMPDYISNGVPLIETGYDSNFFFSTENVQWTFPVYSFLGLSSNNTLTTAIPYGSKTKTIPQIQASGIDITNLVGYQITKITTFDKPYSADLLSTWSKYNYTPQQSMVFLPSFVGKTADIYVKVAWGEGVESREYKIKVIFENKI